MPVREPIGGVVPCAGCGKENGQDYQFCIHCGIPLGAAPPNPGIERKEITPIHRSVDREQKITIISAAAIAAFFAVVFLLTGRNVRAIPALLLLFFPLIPGELVFLLKAGKPVSRVENFHAWLAGKKRADARRRHPLSAWLLRPLLFGPAKIMQWTEGIEDPCLRAGVTISASLYAIGFLIYFTVSIAVAIALR